MFDPISTYRIQFNKEFNFKDFEEIIPYLNDLGIKTIYASPIYEAVPGSIHGYDVVDPNRINPEIGSLNDLKRISGKLKALKMYWIQDIVPNHMGFHQQNSWLMDVLKKGENSVYRHHFDLITKDVNQDPLMVPFLGESLDTVIDKGELELVKQKEGWFLKYFDNYWPVKEMEPEPGKSSIKTVAQDQYYRLCSHDETNERINYRRFFTVNSLICLNVQRPEVFADYHQLTKSLIDEGIFQGLRIDHVDGLADPEGYLQQLRLLCGKNVYITVEKILEPGEALPQTWPVQGTTGYDYLGLVNQLFTNEKAEKKFDAFYKDLGKYSRPVHEQILKKKRAFLQQYMRGELENLYQLLISLDLFEDDQMDPGVLPVFKDVIAELLVRCPVYRFYGNSYPLVPDEAETLEGIFGAIEKETTYGNVAEILRRIILSGDGVSQDYADRVLMFYQRLMQFTGPLMAKGVEDTLMYTYNRFIGNNEVGDSPEVFGIPADDFHEYMIQRQRSWPHTMNTTATHDTKRGEDARARLTALTDLRKDWIAEAAHWHEQNEELKTEGKPDANDEYFIYQTLIATYPEGNAEDENYKERLLDYIEKALRESKRHSLWEEPDLEYESSTRKFILKLLDPKKKFWLRFLVFHKKIAAFGRMASLSSLVLKHSLPGIPDTYQGTELWDLSMVDPDNRRPVDYGFRRAVLQGFAEERPKLAELWQQGANGSIKMCLLHEMLKLRQQHSLLFSDGMYIPLTTSGKYAANVFCFARRYRGDWLVVAVPNNMAGLLNGDTVDQIDWEDTLITLPDGIPPQYKDVFKDLSGIAAQQMALSSLFKDFPLAVLHFKKEAQTRGAGILMHISSLPSAYGIGDFGPSAESFLSFLASTGLKYWQVLPMNPLSSEQGFSPYSSTSVMAGNILLISPEELQRDKLLTMEDLNDYKRKIKRNVNYSVVVEHKKKLLSKGFRTWQMRSTKSGWENAEFEQFCKKEAYWLNDYALFEVIKALHDNKPWFQWPEKYKERDEELLKVTAENHKSGIEEIKWQQFVFHRQWARLKLLAEAQDISLIGDLPFYTALDSADVWAHKNLFNIGADGNAAGIAGVPPDYFNEDGQLWGMPVYNWKTLAKRGFNWWIDRIAKNLEFYDLIRLDHFRAFSEYWEVPAGSSTARSGSWKPGPGAKFFSVLQSHFGELPLIAEDLGEISKDVYDLRDQFNLPGMKVLQFAFGGDMAGSIHAPHNFPSNNCIVYTGTHDNNTTRGWYEKEIDAATKTRIWDYCGLKITSRNVVSQMIRLAFSSTAQIAIIPMQDVLDKTAKNRMNTPASLKRNWTWRFKPDELTPAVLTMIRNAVKLYGR